MLGNLRWTAILLKKGSTRALEGRLEHTSEIVHLSPKVKNALKAFYHRHPNTTSEAHRSFDQPGLQSTHHVPVCERENNKQYLSIKQ